MWCMERAEGEEQDIDKIALRILLINFGAIHTTSMVTLESFPTPSPNSILYTCFWCVFSELHFCHVSSSGEPTFNPDPTRRGRGGCCATWMVKVCIEQDVEDRQLHKGDSTHRCTWYMYATPLLLNYSLASRRVLFADLPHSLSHHRGNAARGPQALHILQRTHRSCRDNPIRSFSLHAPRHGVPRECKPI